MNLAAQFDNQMIDSFWLFLQHEITKHGAAFTNNTGLLYKIPPKFDNTTTYAFPFKPIIADSSISGANILSGIYINGNFINLGESGLTGINYEQGQVYITGNITATISGSYAINEFPVYVTNKEDNELLIENKYQLRPKTAQNITGLLNEEFTYPLIFIRNDNGENVPLAFGGLDDTRINIRGIIIADSQWNLDAVLGICKDSARKYFPLILASEMPFNILGSCKNGNIYNYTTLKGDKIQNGQGIFIEEVSSAKFGSNSLVLSQIKKINPLIHAGIVDFTVSFFREPRRC